LTIPQRFGEGPPPLSLGVEEELVILDAATLDQVGRVGDVVGPLADRGLPGRAKTELHASVFELNTEPCATADDVLESLTVLRRAAAEVAAEAGLAIAATGSHPFASPESQPIVPEERYLDMVAHHGVSARRQNVQGLHVHLAMPSAEDCWRVLEGMLPWLPVLLALSANSPWFDGELTGMASNRAPVLAELPRTGAPPALGSYAAWEAWVERLVRLGVIADYTRIWWDVRPHPALGTLEIRMPDQPTDVRRSAALAALVQALGRRLLLADDVATADRSDYEYNRWAAARFGPAAELIGPDGGRTVKAEELGRELIELAGSDGAPTLAEGCSEAALQARFDDPRDAADDLVARSLA
jgi:carboxylate-amine ligase